MTGSRCMRRAAIRRLMLAGCGGKDVLTLLWEDIDLEGPLTRLGQGGGGQGPGSARTFRQRLRCWTWPDGFGLATLWQA